MKKQEIKKIMNCMDQNNRILVELIQNGQPLKKDTNVPRDVVPDKIGELELRSRQAKANQDRKELELIDLERRVNALENCMQKEKKKARKLKQFFESCLSKQKHSFGKQLGYTKKLSEKNRKELDEMERIMIRFSRFFFINQDIDSMKDIEKSLKRAKKLNEEKKKDFNNDRFLEG